VPSPRERRPEYYGLLTLAAIGCALALLTFFVGGFNTSVAGVRVSSRSVLRPLAVAVLAILIARHRFSDVDARVTRLWNLISRHASAVSLGLGVLTFVIGIRTGTLEAGGADAYGYVSQAVRWLDGALISPEPLAAIAPWPDPVWTFSPLGYRPGVAAATLVPTYPPGLPLTMAAFMSIFGSWGAFLAVPILGAVAIVTTFHIGNRLAGAACGLMSALLLMTSPIFLFHLREPMSDVPAAAWWLVATVLIAVPSPSAAFGAGLAASAAILTRPNLVPLAALLGAFALVASGQTLRSRMQHAAVFGAAVALGCVGVALFNRHLYGSAGASGYGSLEELFKLEHASTNLVNYTRWVVETETPFIFLCVIAPWVLPKHSAGRRLAWFYLGISAVVFGLYLFYVTFDNWTYVRFLLPAIPLLLALCSAVALSLSSRWVHSKNVRAVLAGLFIVLLAWRWDSSGVRGLRAGDPADRRFEFIGHFVRDELPQNAVILAMMHSGSVRHYAGRTTVRWDLLPPEWLDRAMAFLSAQGYQPYLLVEEWERPRFVERFSGYSDLAPLNWEPVLTYRSGDRAEIFELKGRAQDK
jgi:hypothetical protein